MSYRGFFGTSLAKLPSKKALALVLGVLVLFFAMFVLRSFGELGDLGIFRITGFPTTQNYLLVFQNDAERRPTGGFITAYGILRFRFGVPFLDFGNVYDPKLVQKGEQFPDSTIDSLIGGPLFPGHGFRDGNFDPDFPTTAEELIRLYRLGYPKAKFDGVIAIDFTAFENLAKKITPEIIGKTGLFSQIENRVQNIDLHNPDQLLERKNFLSGFAKKLIRQIVFVPPKYSAAAKSILNSLREKHILLYFHDTKLQQIVREKNWAGELPFVADSDFLAINEGNYGGMKSSRYLTRDIFYDIEFTEAEDGSFVPLANLRIILAHRGDTAEPISGYYKSFWRIYTPLGSTLTAGEIDRGFDDTRRQIFGKIVAMNPDETREINLQYKLPLSVFSDGIYRLRLIKQAGSSTDHIRVTVKLPLGFETVSDEFDARENLAIFETNLKSDENLALKIFPDTIPPRLAWQNFVGGIQKINLRFNEHLEESSILPENFLLNDADFRNQRTDAVSISRVQFVPPQNILLELQGVSEECREWYSLQFSGVADRHGNSIPDTKVTVVQWLDIAGENCDPENLL